MESPFGDDELKIAVIGGGTGSFTLLSALKNHTSKIAAIVTIVERDFIERGRGHDLLMKHARKIIDYAVAEDMLLAMFTYGASSPDRNDQKWADAKAWQLAKISAAGLDDLPAYVCNQKDKAAKIMKWYEEGDGFYLPASMSPEVDLQTVARRIILLDDKTASFASLMRPLFGIRVTPEDEANQHDFQSGHLPGGVVAVHGMIEALGAIKAFRSVVAD